MYRLRVDGLPSSPATTMLVGGATIGTTIAYIGARMVIQHPPRPESGYHDGADLAATAAALFRFLHDLL